MTRLAFILFTLFCLQACVSAPSKPIDQAENLALQQQHLQKIAQIQKFAIKGRIGVQTDGKGFSGGLDWQHDDKLDILALYSPLGGQVASIEKTVERVTLTDAKGQQISAVNTDELTQKTLGWQLPLNGLADWVLGRPTQSLIQSSAWDSEGHLINLKQDDWEIEYQDYLNYEGYFLPRKIWLKNNKVRLKLAIEQWHNTTIQ